LVAIDGEMPQTLGALPGTKWQACSFTKTDKSFPYETTYPPVQGESAEEIKRSNNIAHLETGAVRCAAGALDAINMLAASA
jgi:hypothetical protein